MTEIKPSFHRRVFSPTLKQRIAQEVSDRALSASEIARKYDVNTNQVFRWVREYEEGRALWVRRAKVLSSLPSATPAEPSFVPVNVTVPAQHSESEVAVTVEFRSGHKLLLQHATVDVLQQLVVALS